MLPPWFCDADFLAGHIFCPKCGNKIKLNVYTNCAYKQYRVYCLNTLTRNSSLTGRSAGALSAQMQIGQVQSFLFAKAQVAFKSNLCQCQYQIVLTALNRRWLWVGFFGIPIPRNSGDLDFFSLQKSQWHNPKKSTSPGIGDLGKLIFNELSVWCKKQARNLISKSF